MRRGAAVQVLARYTCRSHPGVRHIASKGRLFSGLTARLGIVGGCSGREVFRPEIKTVSRQIIKPFFPLINSGKNTS